MNTTEKTGLKLVKGVDPDEALKLPKGKLFHAGSEIPFSDGDVLDCAGIHIDQDDASEVFTTQAHVIENAGNYLGWGETADYEAQE